MQQQPKFEADMCLCGIRAGDGECRVGLGRAGKGSGALISKI